MTRHYSPELGYHSSFHALFNRRRRPHHDRAPGPARSSAERGQRARVGGAGAPPPETSAEEGSSVRHHRGLRLPHRSDPFRGALDPLGMGQAHRRSLSPLTSPPILLERPPCPA